MLIAYVDTQHYIRSALVGALATDPVVPERRRRRGRATRA
jgi:hypothetical protein